MINTLELIMRRNFEEYVVRMIRELDPRDIHRLYDMMSPEDFSILAQFYWDGLPIEDKFVHINDEDFQDAVLNAYIPRISADFFSLVSDYFVDEICVKIEFIFRDHEKDQTKYDYYFIKSPS